MLNKLLQKITEPFTQHHQDVMSRFPKTREHMIQNLIKRKIVKKSTLRFHGILLTFFGCGKWKYGPGTLASFVTILIWLSVSLSFFNLEADTFYELLFWLTIITLLFIYGLLFIPLYSTLLDSTDHPSIVIDEVVGQLVALCLTYPFVKKYYFNDTWFLSNLVMFAHVFSCFIFFRFFDIAKPFFIGWVDRNIKNSFGVMFDDLLCGLISAGINIFIFLTYESAISDLHNGHISIL